MGIRSQGHAILKQHIDKRQLSLRLLAALERQCFRGVWGSDWSAPAFRDASMPIPILPTGIGLGNGTAGRAWRKECALKRMMPRLAVASHARKDPGYRMHRNAALPETKDELSQPVHSVKKTICAILVYKLFELCSRRTRTLCSRGPDSLRKQCLG